MRGGRPSMPFAIPCTSRESRHHVNDRYFCIVYISSFKKTKHSICYKSRYFIICCASSEEPWPSANDLESEDEGEDFEPESEEYNIGHTDDEKKKPAGSGWF